MAYFFVPKDTYMSTLQQPQVGVQLREQWRTWMLFRMGHPIVKVETTQANLDIAIDIAVRNFSQWCPGNEKLIIFETVSKQISYNLLDIVPEYIDIKEVIYNSSVTDMLLTSFLGGITTDFAFGGGQVSFSPGSYSSMVDFTLLNMYNEMYLRTVGREGQGRIIGQTLHLSPPPSANVKCGLVYTSMMLDQDVRRDEWIREWALTELKLSMGSARRKYGSVPGPKGDITMDGDALITEAREDQKELRERLNEFREPYGINMG